MSSLLSSCCSFKRSSFVALFYDRLSVKLECFLNSVGNASLISDRTVKVSKQGHFLYTDKLNLVIFVLRHSDFQIRHFDLAGKVKKVIL